MRSKMLNEAEVNPPRVAQKIYSSEDSEDKASLVPLLNLPVVMVTGNG